MTTEDKIIHALHAINTTMAQSVTAPSDMQLNTILHDYHRHTTMNDAPPGVHPTGTPTTTPANSARGPGVRPPASPPGVPAPTPQSWNAVSNQWTTVPARPRRPTLTPASHAPDLKPIAARTRSRGMENYYC